MFAARCFWRRPILYGAEVSDPTTLLLLAAPVICGLMAGVFFAFSVSVMRALEALPPTQSLTVMQQINRSILNPVFLTCFVGSALLCLAVIGLTFARGVAAAHLWIAGAVTYLAGAFLVTVLVNVPLNNGLDRVASTDEQAAALWTAYLRRWTAWNHVRAAASLVATVLLVMALAAFR